MSLFASVICFSFCERMVKLLLLLPPWHCEHEKYLCALANEAKLIDAYKTYATRMSQLPSKADTPDYRAKMMLFDGF